MLRLRSRDASLNRHPATPGASYPSNHSIASVVRRSEPGSTWALVLSVVEVSACPSMAETAVMGSPSAMNSDAAAWRTS
jgi:hypothetical protein